jgi:hypothetical protein
LNAIRFPFKPQIQNLKSKINPIHFSAKIRSSYVSRRRTTLNRSPDTSTSQARGRAL